MKNIIKVRIETVYQKIDGEWTDRELVYPVCSKALILASLYGRHAQKGKPDLGFATGKQLNTVLDGEAPISKIKKLGFKVEVWEKTGKVA